MPIYRVVIDYDRCQGCKNCIKACGMGVLEAIDDMPYAVNPKECRGCEDCVKACPNDAIKIVYEGIA